MSVVVEIGLLAFGEAVKSISSPQINLSIGDRGCGEDLIATRVDRQRILFAHSPHDRNCPVLADQIDLAIVSNGRGEIFINRASQHRAFQRR